MTLYCITINSVYTIIFSQFRFHTDYLTTKYLQITKLEPSLFCAYWKCLLLFMLTPSPVGVASCYYGERFRDLRYIQSSCWCDLCWYDFL